MSTFFAGLKRKEEWAYRQLIDQWSYKMFQVAYRFLGKKEDAEEIIQDVLQKVLEKNLTFEVLQELPTVHRILSADEGRGVEKTL